MLGFVEADPTNSALVEEAAAAALEVGRPEQALALIKRYQSFGEAPASLINLSAVAAMSLGRFGEAAETLQDLSSEAGADPGIRFNLAWCEAMLGRWTKTAELLDDEVMSRVPASAALKVQALHHLGRMEEALEFGQAACALHPEDKALHAAIAVVALDAEAFDLAATHAKLSGDKPSGLAVTGILLLDDNRPETALGCFDSALEHAPNEKRALLGKGLSLLSLGDYGQAAEWLDRGAAAFETHSGSWIASAWGHFAKGDYQTARERFAAAEKIDPTFAEVHGGLAVLDVLEGDEEAGRRRAETALRLDPTCLAGALARTLLLRKAGDISSADRITKIALNAQLGPDGRTLAQAIQAFGRRTPH
ncbi:MAG TPA: tetratricopeptide repeat protein [Phenylobacterium sp.]